MKAARMAGRALLYTTALAATLYWTSIVLSLLAMAIQSIAGACTRQELGLDCGTDIMNHVVNHWFLALIVLVAPPNEMWLIALGVILAGHVSLLVIATRFLIRKLRHAWRVRYRT